MPNITLNSEKNGIEIRFDSKPAAEIISNLKANGFRWSSKQKMWYAKQTAERMEFTGKLGEVSTVSEKQKPEVYDLWAMTRTEKIENNFEKYHIYDTKEIAAIIRKHLKSRFPMCKWSVTKDGNSIYINILVSPFAIDSDELKAIVRYAYTFAQSYNYDNSDSYSDYFDVNFYCYENNIVKSYRYEQREMTDSERNISEAFKAEKSAFDIAEEERKKKELEESIKKAEIERKKAEERAIKENLIHDKIESSFVENTVDYFVMNVLAPELNKNCTVEEIMNCGEYTRENCKVSKEIHFDKETYNLFAERLLDDYSFLDGMGGTTTDDLRIQSMQDYDRMSEAERKTVEWYNHNCVSVYCEDELKLVVDPQGYSYARYTFIVDSESTIVKEYKGKSGISEEEYQHNVESAETLEDVSESVIINNELKDTWDNENFGLYRSLIKKWIFTNENYKFDVGVVRAFSNERLKSAMYRILTEPEEITEQFKQADIQQGQKVTIVMIGDFGNILTSRVTVDSVEYGKYAQYNNAVKLTFKPEKKRNLYYQWYYRDMLVFNGWIEVPESLLWEEVSSNTPGISARMTRFLSCDRKQYDVILDYFKSQGIKPIINTYKPQF